MPLPIAHGESYIRISRVFVDSGERSEGTVSDYTFDLPEEIQQVVAIELTGYVIPSSLTPTFIADENDCLDFELSDGTTTTVFTAKWPSQSYTYENVSNPYLSYVLSLKQILTDAVLADPTFGSNGISKPEFVVESDPETRTVVRVEGASITSFRFLFASGPCEKTSPHTAMGFEKVDTPVGALTITSPLPVKLDPFPRVDILIDEFPDFKPLDIIYNRNATYYGTTYNDTNVSRARLISGSPVRRLKQLHIRLRIGDEPVPDLEQNEHSFCFTVFSIASEEDVPAWLNQMMTL